MSGGGWRAGSPLVRGQTGGAGPGDDPWRRVLLGLTLFATVVVLGTLGYIVLGLGAFDALYQTVTTITTVGFREIGEVDTAYRIFTMVLILLGVGTALYTFTVLLETLIEGRLTDLVWRRRMDRDIARLRGHVIICGWGRLGRTIAHDLAAAGRELVVIDRADHVRTSPHPFVEGEATDDATLTAAGLEHAGTLIAALDTDADNLYVTLSARSARPDLFIIARARMESADAKLRQAGADRVVNPQHIGGSRIASMTLQPNVLEFVDVVFHERSLEFRLEELPVPPGSALAGTTLASSRIRERTGAMVLALRDPSGDFRANPPADTAITPGQVLIVIGTAEQLEALTASVAPATPGH